MLHYDSFGEEAEQVMRWCRYGGWIKYYKGVFKPNTYSAGEKFNELIPDAVKITYQNDSQMVYWWM